jgi:hypothetical protein
MFMGNFGHNMLRFTWLWYGGFLIIARYCVQVRLADPEAWLPTEDESQDLLDEEYTPEGWVYHFGHTEGNRSVTA